jgi:hypothetical protein
MIYQILELFSKAKIHRNGPQVRRPGPRRCGPQAHGSRRTGAVEFTIYDEDLKY